MTEPLELLKQLDEKYPDRDMSAFAEAQNKLNNLGANMPQINWKITPEETIIVHKIVDRAMGLFDDKVWEEPMDCMMDVVAAHKNGCELDLEALFEFDDFEFVHDLAGIAKHLNRETGAMEGCFLPRSAR